MKPPTYKVRFEFHVSAFFNVDAQEYGFEIAGRQAKLSSVHGRPLKNDEAAAIHVGGFAAEAEAAAFGSRIQRAATLAGTRCGLGVDIGDNQPGARLASDLRAHLLKKFGCDTRPHVHGVDVYREDIPAGPLIVEGRGSVLFEPGKFISELSASYESWSQPVSPELEHALRLRCEASLAGDSLAQMILAIASVEALTPEERWSPNQEILLRSLAAEARQYPGIPPIEITEVVERIIGQRKLGVNQGFRRLFDRIGLQHLWPRWNKVYSVRSRVLHGDAPIAQARDALDEARSLSREIVLKAAAMEIPGASVGL